MPSWRLPVSFLVAAWGCLLVAYLNRDVYPPAFGRNPQVDPDAGWTAYAPLDKADIPPSRFAYPEIWDPYLWAGAGVALLIAAVVVVAFPRPRRQRT